jgi:hypothetical protein
MKPVRVKAWWIFTKLDHYEPHLKIKENKKEINISGKEWERINVLARRSYPLIIYEDEKGGFSPVRIKRVDGENSREMMNTDKWRDFKKFIHDTHSITQNRFAKLLQAAIIVILSIFCMAIVVVGFVLLSKFGVDHTQVLMQQTGNNTNGLLNFTTGFLGG